MPPVPHTTLRSGHTDAGVLQAVAVILPNRQHRNNSGVLADLSRQKLL